MQYNGQKNFSDTSSDEEAAPIVQFQQQKKNGHPRQKTLQPEHSFMDKPKISKRKHEGGSQTDPKYLKMMKNMGYQEGKGLGKEQQGIVNPILASDHKANRGLGYTIEGLDPDDTAEWDESQEYVCVEEEVFWLDNFDNNPVIDTEELDSWMEIGGRSLQIDHETFFCDEKIVKNVISNKTIFDKLESKEMRKARSKANPFETIAGMFFQNRAAPKMANMDRVFDFMFTKPLDEIGRSIVHQDEPLYFADVCAAPGGFSEYVLWRNKDNNKGLSRVKGFGFTLKDNDFKLENFLAASPEFLEPHYGVDGDGDIFKSHNIRSFTDFVYETTDGRGIHLMMADGGFSVEGQECIQEILSKQLYLCQFLTALIILREGGNFVCKVFDLFTPFSVGLIYLMYTCFKRVSIHKPNTSRPANSERYIIFKWKKAETGAIEDYMFKINDELNSCQSPQNKKNLRDVTSVVPFEVMEEDTTFFDYIRSSNNILGKRQILALQKIQTFCKNKDLFEHRQSSLKYDSITYWNMPMKTRTARCLVEPHVRANELLIQKNGDVLDTNVPALTKELLEDMKSRHDYHFVVLASHSDPYKMERGFFFGMGGKKVLFYSAIEKAWKKLNTRIELPCDTIVFAEIANEIISGRKTNALHLIDGVLLNGFNISQFKLTNRHLNLKVFAKTCNRSTLKNITPIRCKELHSFRDIDQVLSEERLSLIGKKRIYTELYSEHNTDKNLDIIPTGILFLRNSHVDWTRCFSTRQRKLYYYNIVNKDSKYDWLPEMAGSVHMTLGKGSYWWWSNGVCIREDDVPSNNNQVHLEDVLNRLKNLPP